MGQDTGVSKEEKMVDRIRVDGKGLEAREAE